MPRATPYPEANALLAELLDGARAILGVQFVGMMLYGSLAAGDFDTASDVDVLVVTEGGVSSDTFAALAAMHARMAQGDSPWAIQLEISYIPLAALRRHDSIHATHPRLDRGQGERLHWMQHDVDWIVQRHALRERGLVIAGPPPASLIDPVSVDDLRGAMRPLLRRRAQSLRDHPHDLSFRGYQSYVVLTVCRMLYTLANGTVVSKPTAARWALATLDARWTNLIERALAGRQTPGAEVPPEDVSGTLAFIRYALGRRREGSVILFETADGRFALQLRDDRPDVSCPNYWGLFGGWCEPNETPEQTIIREINEELSLQLDPSKLRHLRRHRDGDIVSHVFHYPVTDALESAPLTEGQQLVFWRLSDLEQRNVVPRHYAILAWYKQQKAMPSSPEVP